MDQQQQQQQQLQQQSAQDNSSKPELHYEYTDSAYQRQDQRQMESVYYQQDVRMKRHPELQPYVPSDRYTVASSSSLTNNNRGGGGTASSAIGGTKTTLNNKYGIRYAPSLASSASGQPKKYCSMTRLNQLAQPKKRPVNAYTTTLASNNSNGSNTNNTATLSTNSSTRSINSVSRSGDRQQDSVGGIHRSKKQHQQQPRPAQSAPKPQKPVKQPTPQAGGANQRSQQQQQSIRQNQQEKQRERLDSGNKQQQERLNSDRPTTQPQQQQPAPPPITPIAVKPVHMSNPTTNVFPMTTPQSSTPVVMISGELAATETVVAPRKTDKQSTPAAQQPPTPASSLEEELETAANNCSNKFNTTRDIIQQHNETSSLADQVAEISVTDNVFYQSAASDLMSPSRGANQDSENNLTNGSINFDRRTADSLCREFEQDLIAKGIVRDSTEATSNNDITFDNYTSPRANMSRSSVNSTTSESIRRNSAATTIVTSEQNSQNQEERDEDDRRLKAEKELREKARLEEEERKQRELLVENIMSRFSQGSVS